MALRLGRGVLRGKCGRRVGSGLCQLPGNGHDVLSDGATEIAVWSLGLKDLLHLGIGPDKVVDLIFQLFHLVLEDVLVFVELASHTGAARLSRACRAARASFDEPLRVRI